MVRTPTEILYTHIINRIGSDISNIDYVINLFEPLQVKRNKHVLENGQTCKYVYFIASGALQVYAYDKQGNETTRDIVIENNWCSDLISFGSGNPATENIRAIEPCDILAINKENFTHLMETVPQFDAVYKQILEASYANSVYRINTFIAMSALDRIKWLMDNRPKLMSRLSSKLIASYLGISQETFSRLKSKL